VSPEHPLQNSRQERFIQNVTVGMNQTSAYIAAGYSSRGAKVAAAKLVRRADISARLSHLHANGAAIAELTASDLMIKGLALVDAAAAANDFATASVTLERVAKIGGFWIDKSKTETTHTLSVASLLASLQ
jgi:phage terminase small subunit